MLKHLFDVSGAPEMLIGDKGHLPTKLDSGAPGINFAEKNRLWSPVQYRFNLCYPDEET